MGVEPQIGVERPASQKELAQKEANQGFLIVGVMLAVTIGGSLILIKVFKPYRDAIPLELVSIPWIIACGFYTLKLVRASGKKVSLPKMPALKANTYPCPSCGFLVFDGPPGSYAICKICDWEDDQVQLANPTSGGGANSDSLAQSQEKILKLISDTIVEYQGFRRDPKWRPLRREEILFHQSEREAKRFRMGVVSRDRCYWNEIQMNSLELAVLDKMLAGDHPILEALRRSLLNVVMKSRKLTGVGFFTDLRLPDGTLFPHPGPSRYIISDVNGQIEGLAHGAGFVAFIEGGELTLEGFTYDEPWPKEIGAFELKYSDPERKEFWAQLK